MYKFIVIVLSSIAVGSLGSAVAQSSSRKMEGAFDYRQVEPAGKMPKPSKTPMPEYNKKDPNLYGSATKPLKNDQFEDIRKLDKKFKGRVD